jgi:hypothetical protein
MLNVIQEFTTKEKIFFTFSIVNFPFTQLYGYEKKVYKRSVDTISCS